MIDLPLYPYDERLIQATREDHLSTVEVYRPPEVLVVVGQGSRLKREVNLDAVQRDGVPLYRRRGGGCAVVLDSGNLVVSTAAWLQGRPRIHTWFQELSDWVQKGLQDVGVGGVSRREVSDLVVGRRKIGGACIYRSGSLVHYSTTLLVEPQVELMERYLLHPPREPDYRQGRGHAEFVTQLPAPRGVEALRRALEAVLRPPELSVKPRGSSAGKSQDTDRVVPGSSGAAAECPTTHPVVSAPIRRRFPASPGSPTGGGPAQKALVGRRRRPSL